MSEQTATKERTIINCAVIEAPPEKIFDAFTSAESLAKFWSHRAEFDRKVGGQWQMWDDYNCGHGKVVTLEAPTLVRIEWSWYKTDLKPTTVTYRILPHEKGTLVIVHHHGWGTGPDWDFEYNDHSDGWPKVIASLASFLGATVIWATPATAAPDAQTYEILKNARDKIQSHYDVVIKDRDELQKAVNKLKKGTGVVNLKEVDRLEKEFDDRDCEARRLELDLRDVDQLMK
jgi:uncharacterized protein YndB with AHSA1/START domain